MYKHKPLFRSLAVLSLFCFGLGSNAFAGEPVVWEMSSRNELLKGEARGVSVTDSGVVTLAPGFRHIFDTEHAYFSSTAAGSGANVYRGTRHAGPIFRVTP